MIQRIPGKDLRVGDTLRYLEPHPWVTVTAIRPYKGPLKDTVEFLVDTRPGVGISICFGDEVEVDRPETRMSAREAWECGMTRLVPDASGCVSDPIGVWQLQPDGSYLLVRRHGEAR